MTAKRNWQIGKPKPDLVLWVVILKSQVTAPVSKETRGNKLETYMYTVLLTQCDVLYMRQVQLLLNNTSPLHIVFLFFSFRQRFMFACGIENFSIFDIVAPSKWRLHNYSQQMHFNFKLSTCQCIETRGSWGEQEILWEHDLKGKCFHSFFEFSQTFSTTVFSISLKNTATKQNNMFTVIINILILFAYTRGSPVFLLSYRNMTFNQSVHYFLWVIF